MTTPSPVSGLLAVESGLAAHLSYQSTVDAANLQRICHILFIFS
jgi:hypothetical protein